LEALLVREAVQLEEMDLLLEQALLHLQLIEVVEVVEEPFRLMEALVAEVL
jgi:hypothetical protein